MIDDSGTYLQPQQSGLGSAAAAAAAVLERARGCERVTVSETSSAAGRTSRGGCGSVPARALVAAPVGSLLFGFLSK